MLMELNAVCGKIFMTALKSERRSLTIDARRKWLGARGWLQNTSRWVNPFPGLLQPGLKAEGNRVQHQHE